MRNVLRAFALLRGSALCGLIPSQTMHAADLEPVVVEEQARLGWHVSLVGGRKWGEGDIDLIWRRHIDCPPQSACPVDREGELHGEVEDGWIVGGAIGTQLLENFWADIEASYTRLDTETFSAYLSGGLGVAHVDAELGFEPSLVEGKPSSYIPSVSVEAEGWSFAYQLGVGLLIGLSENVPSDIGYRLKVIPNVDVDDPVFCG